MLRSDGDADASAQDGRREAETSEAMVVKIAKKLGFSGFKELRGALRPTSASPPPICIRR